MMNAAVQLIQKAKFEVARSFCDSCSKHIANRLQDIDGIKNVRLYPLERVVSFHFNKPFDLSNALNELTTMGYPEKGEIIKGFETGSFKCCQL